MSVAVKIDAAVAVRIVEASIVVEASIASVTIVKIARQLILVFVMQLATSSSVSPGRLTIHAPSRYP